MKTSRIEFSSQQVKESFLKRLKEGINGDYCIGISPEILTEIENELTSKESRQSAEIKSNLLREYLTSHRFVKALMKSRKEEVFLIVKNGDQIAFILNNHVDTIIKGDRFLKRTIPGLFIQDNCFFEEDIKSPPRKKRIRFLEDEHHWYPIKIVLENSKLDPEGFIKEVAS